MSITTFDQAWKKAKVAHIKKRLKTPKGKKQLAKDLVQPLIDVEEMDMETFLQHFVENIELTLEVATDPNFGEEKKSVLPQGNRFELIDL